ncbi:MAG: hypothetical protein ACK479_07060 [Fluviicola sp.]
MKIQKSSRHSKITGDFAESLILYWLSKYGFESAKVDHTGIDLIARNTVTNEVMGISVKSRSRNDGKEETALSITNDNFIKMDQACLAFNCQPYFALVIDELNSIKIFILRKEKLFDYFKEGKKSTFWKMSKSWLSKYDLDDEIIKIEFSHNTKNWWK